jgi:hypothetical protein
VTHGTTLADWLAERYERFGYRFVPLVRRDLSLICGIDILFLRPDQPGDVLKSGDIDNRLKTLFDALQMPRDKSQLPANAAAPGDDETPFFCLLEDDSVITKLSVETDLLLQPTGERFDVNDARLVITVRLRPYDVNPGNQMFG